MVRGGAVAGPEGRVGNYSNRELFGNTLLGGPFEIWSFYLPYRLPSFFYIIFLSVAHRYFNFWENGMY